MWYPYTGHLTEEQFWKKARRCVDYEYTSVSIIDTLKHLVCGRCRPNFRQRLYIGQTKQLRLSDDGMCARQTLTITITIGVKHIHKNRLTGVSFSSEE